MLNKFLILSLLVFCFLLSLFYTVQHGMRNHFDEERKETSHALEAFEWWYAQRAAPNDLIPNGAFQKAARYVTSSMKKESKSSSLNGVSSQWVSIGPTNIGGRTLSLAVNPSNPNIVWAGAASGGLWKSTTGGEGSNPWTYVPTGLPALSVSTIALDPTNPNIMYIGTGEVSYYHRPLVGTPGARASYGMGILKSTDGGNSWAQTGLTFTFPQITAIEKLVINPQNTKTLYAATSEGTYKSNDAGVTWVQVHSVLMTIDIVIDPVDTAILYNSCGNYNASPNPGLYKSTDVGTTWSKLTTGLPSSNFGRTALALSPTNPSIVYAGISNASSQGTFGLFKTTDAGASWSNVSSLNYVNIQGWYNNVVAVHPTNPDTVFCSGYDIYKSTNGGPNLGNLPSGSVHLDHHAIAFDPTNPRVMYLGTDGGVYKTKNGGDSFIDLNNGFVTTQFYSSFANSALDSNTALGGLQDNGTLKYYGSGSWAKVYGGDGGWCAIDPTNNSIMYAEYIYLELTKSVTGGGSFFGITNGLSYGPGNANFISPYVICPSNPNILYAASKNVYKTTDGGGSWFPPNGGAFLNGTNVACIGVSRTSSDTLLAATGDGSAGITPLFQVFRSTDGGQSWVNVTGSLPNRYPTDIEFDPTNSSNAYLTYSGYGSSHVFRSTNAGLTWIDISSNLPDIPHQSVAVDWKEPLNIYVGTDLGVDHSSNGGGSWEDFSTGMPFAMVLDVTISRVNDALRASTFGNGVYERKLFRTPTLALTYPNGGEILVADRTVNVKWTQSYLDRVKLEFTSDNGLNWSLIADSIPASSVYYSWSVPAIATSQASLRISDAMSGLVADSTAATFSVIVNPEAEKGWNIVSVDVAAPDPRKIVLFPTSVSAAFAYSGTYQQYDTLLNGVGYWLKFSYPQHVDLAGDSIFTDTIHVKAGWNLIGSVSKPVDANNIIAIPPVVISSQYWGYQSGYVASSVIKPLRGYWVKVNSDGELVLNSSSALPKLQTRDDVRLKKMNSITVEDNAGHSQTLLFGKTSEIHHRTAEWFEMPPIPPSGIFDTRFHSQRMAEFLPDQFEGPVKFPISIRSAAYPLIVSWNMNGDHSQSSALTIDGIIYPVTSIGKIIITHQPFSDIVLEVSDVPNQTHPVAFILHQNYPNPFNPSTVINYQLPIAHYVTLKVYNTLGQEVVTLVHNEFMDKGVHTVKFDAGQLASGIYFYQLTAGEFMEARKMVLIR